MIRPIKQSCSHCTFLMDLSGLIPRTDIPDGITWRCGKDERFLEGWPRPIGDPSGETCHEFLAFDPKRSHWEWDENKSQRNIEKHGISFQKAVSALDSDGRAIRVQSKNWESLEDLDYQEAGIPRTMSNIDPVRDLYVYEHAGKVWVLISTLRGELGFLTQRVISVRRARVSEQELYRRRLG